MNVIKLDAINSTNEFLKKYVKKNSIKNTQVVYTFNQTKGKGQRGNKWISEPGKNLAFSICLHPKKMDVKDLFSLNMSVSLFIINFLNSLNIPNLKIKWPNDILSGEKKICGILNEINLKGDSIENVVIGFGININQENFENLLNASSLKLINKTNFDLDKIVGEIIFRLKKYNLFPESKTEIIKMNKDYHDCLYGLNIFKNFRLKNNNIFKGKIISVRKDGKIKIKTEDDNIKNYSFQEIQMVLNLN
jgi:BirA family biotin operon repressor/biotin-[acetyl-CoA-carboxylase] ligase